MKREKGKYLWVLTSDEALCMPLRGKWKNASEILMDELVQEVWGSKVLAWQVLEQPRAWCQVVPQLTQKNFMRMRKEYLEGRR